MNTSTSSSEAIAAERAPRKSGRRLSAVLSAPLRRLLGRMLGTVTFGSLVVELPDGQTVEGRGATPGPHAALVLHRWRALGRLAFQGDIGLAESYRDGDWSTPDLTALLEFGIRNESGWGTTLEASWPVRAGLRLYHLARSNTRRGSRQNISFHYDMGNEFYARWLDPKMIYSSALYDHDEQGHSDRSLEQAQAAKLDRIIDLLDIQGRSEVLEIGCGWGALAMALATRRSASVTGLTLSSEQLAYANDLVAKASLSGQVDLRLQDYRDAEGTYDRIVSIEMLEAVGEKYWPAYFDTLRDRLRPHGKAVIQVITIAEANFDHYRTNADFIQRFIFPGGMLPTVTAMREQASKSGFTMETAESFGLSYAETLVEWRHRFLRAWPAIQTLGFDDKFRRLWEYYLCYCEAGFRTRRVDVGLYVLTRADSGAGN